MTEPRPSLTKPQQPGQPARPDRWESAETPAPTSSRAQTVGFATVNTPYLPILVGAFLATILISNIVATKGVTFFPSLSLESIHLDGIVTDGAFYLFPLAYIVGDVISEVYGLKTMRWVILGGFVTSLVAAGCYTLTVHLPAAPFYENQEQFEAVAGPVPRFLLAGICGYVVGEFLNSYVLVRMKQRSGERGLFRRLLGSTGVGEAADTIIFCAIAAGALGITKFSDFFFYALWGYIWKCAVEIVFMPVTYRVCQFVKAHEPSYVPAPGR